MSFKLPKPELVNVPDILKDIPSAPKKLYLVGDNILQDPNAIYLTFVGSRKSTSYGEQVAKKIISGLNPNFIIVSGLAFGIDAVCHKLAIEHNLRTIAFPGSGLDEKVIYPATNLSLAKNIVEKGGALVSEFENDQKAGNWTFPRRNRLMAGIAQAVIVIEAEEMSGSRITAKLATEYNRDVFAVPGSIFSPLSIGTNNLIKEGAYPLLSASQLLVHFGLKKTLDNNSSFVIPEDLTDNAKVIINYLLKEPLSRTELCDLLGLEITDININLSALELRDLVEEKLGKFYLKYN